jgi:outer membrane lipoprotein LolB
MGPALPSRILLALLLALAWLTGCRTLPPTTAESWEQRCTRLAGLPEFAFSGRLAVSGSGAGFSASVNWQQRGVHSSATLRGPLGFGLLQVELDPSGLKVRDGSGQAVDAAALGMELPLTELRHWLLACQVPGGAVTEVLDAEQRLASLEQNGWRIEYLSYQPVAGVHMPVRIRVRGEGSQLQLAIHRWQLP